MNSFILTSIAAFFRSLPKLFKNSALYSVIDRIYAAFSRAWRSGKIVNTVEKEGTVASSAVRRLCRLPFTAAEKLRDRIYPALEKAVSKSVICRTARLYVQNFMALNTRFFGIMLIAMSAAYLPLHMLSSGRISKLALAAAAVGAILLIMNYNAMNFLNTSKLVDFIKSAAGFRQLDFSFFDEEYTKGRGRLVCGAAIGALTGAVMSVQLIYGAAVPFAAGRTATASTSRRVCCNAPIVRAPGWRVSGCRSARGRWRRCALSQRAIRSGCFPSVCPSSRSVS